MKKIIVVLILFLLSTQFGYAQLKGGLKGGLNVADIIISNKSNYFEGDKFNTRMSYHFGSYVQDSFSKHFGWQIEMLFSNKGYEFETEGISTKTSLNYLNWPILLVYKIGNKLELNSGIELGLLIAGEDLYKDFDLGIDIGMEYDISEKIMAGIRYNHGLPFKMNISENELSGAKPQYQHSVLQFYLGFNIVNEKEETK